MANEQKTEAPENGYLIFKCGMMYRPNSQGYTNEKICAGRYSLKEAISITHPNGEDGPRDGMHYRHESEVSSEAEEIMKAAVGATVRACAEVADDAALSQLPAQTDDELAVYYSASVIHKRILALEPDAQQALDDALATAKAEGVREVMKIVDQNTFDAAGGQLVIDYKAFRMTCERLLTSNQKETK